MGEQGGSIHRPKCHVGRYVDGEGGLGGCCWLAIGRGVVRGEARQTTQGTCVLTRQETLRHVIWLDDAIDGRGEAETERSAHSEGACAA